MKTATCVSSPYPFTIRIAQVICLLSSSTCSQSRDTPFRSRTLTYHFVLDIVRCSNGEQLLTETLAKMDKDKIAKLQAQVRIGESPWSSRVSRDMVVLGWVLGWVLHLLRHARDAPCASSGYLTVFVCGREALEDSTATTETPATSFLSLISIHRTSTAR